MTHTTPFIIAVAASLIACGATDSLRNKMTKPSTQSKRSAAPVIAQLEVAPASKPPLSDSANEQVVKAAERVAAQQGSTKLTEQVTGEVTFEKAAIFDRVFLYGFDLQYSSGSDAEYSLIPQSQAIGHIPATFRRISDKLQLLGDQSRLFESDINHPEVLLAEYRIVRETAGQLTVAFERSGIVVNEVVNGAGSPAPKQSWIRSLKYVAEGDYILQESAIMLQNGTVQTYMESLFPRDSLVPTGYVPLLNDADAEPLAARYRFLSNESVYLQRSVDGQNVRVKTSAANRFHLGEQGTIDFYVTPNIPDKFLPVIKSGVEGWNRYFNQQMGRGVMRFIGKLPAGVNLGDPRYNVINWDSVAQAGAAYESQAADPVSGIQSHSLIYLPLAWYNIGAELWKKRVDGTLPSAAAIRQAVAPRGTEVVFGANRRVLSCVRSVDELALPVKELIDAIKSEDAATLLSVDEFSMRLMVAVLFHEVGHSLGLAHNFKASMAYDGTQPISDTNPASWSVMDYNYYQVEQDLFTQVGDITGPLLEYDRQILSQLYHGGVDVKPSDLVVPACEDAEADATAGGVDPLCVRYDSEKDPIDGVRFAYGNVVQHTGARGVDKQTLSEAVTSLTGTLTQRIADPTGLDNADALIAQGTIMGAKVGELVRYYLASGAQSLRSNITINQKALRVWQPVDGINEDAFRGDYAKIMKDVLTWTRLPHVPEKTLKNLSDAIFEAAATNAMGGPTADDRSKVAKKVQGAFDAAVATRVQASLSRIQQSLYGILTFQEESPFAIRYSPSGNLSQFEDFGAETLSRAVLRDLGTASSATILTLADDRMAAAKALLTYSGTSDLVGVTATKLEQLIAKGRTDGNQNLVDHGRKLLKVLR